MRVPWPAARISAIGALTRLMLNARSRGARAAGRLGEAAGGQGFEPRFSGPKPDVLPLDDPPRADAARIVAATGAAADLVQGRRSCGAACLRRRVKPCNRRVILLACRPTKPPNP